MLYLVLHSRVLYDIVQSTEWVFEVYCYPWKYCTCTELYFVTYLEACIYDVARSSVRAWHTIGIQIIFFLKCLRSRGTNLRRCNTWYSIIHCTRLNTVHHTTQRKKKGACTAVPGCLDGASRHFITLAMSTLEAWSEGSPRTYCTVPYFDLPFEQICSQNSTVSNIYTVCKWYKRYEIFVH